MLEKDLQALVDLWRDIRSRSGKIPSRSEFNPMRLRSRLAQVHLLEFNGPRTLVYRLSGTSEVERLGEDPKGKDYFTLVDSDARNYFRDNMHSILFYAAGILVTTEEVYPSGRITSTRFIALPLRDEQNASDQVIAIVTTTDDWRERSLLSPPPKERPWYDYVISIEPVDLGDGIPPVSVYKTERDA